MSAHIVIDGGIAKDGDPRANERGPDGLLDPNAIADTYLQLHRQHAQRLGLGDRAAPLGREFLTLAPALKGRQVRHG